MFDSTIDFRTCRKRIYQQIVLSLRGARLFQQQRMIRLKGENKIRKVDAEWHIHLKNDPTGRMHGKWRVWKGTILNSFSSSSFSQNKLLKAKVLVSAPRVPIFSVPISWRTFLWGDKFQERLPELHWTLLSANHLCYCCRLCRVNCRLIALVGID